MNQTRVIVITGVSHGLGRAMVEEFHARGHTVFGCARTPAAMGELNRKWDGRFAVVDVVDDGAVARWAEQVRQVAGAPDLLLNNAAVINRNAALWDVPAGEFNRVIDVNLKGVANVIRHFVPLMIARRAGVIVNFSSGWGRSTAAEVAPYCATKWGIEGLTQALAQELPRGLAAVPLNPGIINTEMLQSCFGEGAAQYPTAGEWAKTAVPYLLQLTAKDNGRPLTAP